MDRTARTLLQLARRILSELDLDALLGRVLQASRELTGARYAPLGILDDDKRQLARFVTLGVDESVPREIGTCRAGAECSAS